MQDRDREYTPTRVAAAALAALILAAAAGCDQSEPPPPPVAPTGPAERAGRQIDDAIQQSGARAQTALDQAREGLAKAASEAAARLEAASEALESKPSPQDANH
ncbi:hypothetical protein [Imhoffiella purpurea]|uniref:Lipoprotein n=1 Tax=Imhoffiella purpurea TaxID=1249627 RepID=W9VZW5_9GAMM|nr:hypothetical protein [Imhoffiella purpurea]EXJ15900.1 hypothetical protein D779_0764 [Imhoffiella purpurea]